MIDQVTRFVHQLDRQIEKQAANDPNARLLMTIPGIGPYRGLMLATELSPMSVSRSLPR